MVNRKHLFLVLGILFLSAGNASAESFKEQQLRFSRVRTAFKEKEQAAKDLFREKGISYPPREIFIRVLKKEAVLELWASNATDFVLVKEYKICSSSGELGPKRRMGDGQVPEGFYFISHFNPESWFYLSLKVSYPNESDRILGVRNHWSGDIFIHGNCVTIGCVPIEDEWIKELYLIAVEAKSAGQERIPVHIFPARMSGFQCEAGSNFCGFWSNMKEGFDFFEKNRRLPKISVNGKGKYIFRGD